MHTRTGLVILALALGVVAGACSTGEASTPLVAAPAPATTQATSADAGTPLPPDLSDAPIAGLSSDDVARFNDGDALFNLTFREADGLGPLYIRTGCGSCHAEASRGPGFVQKMAVVLADDVTPAPDQSKLTFGHAVLPSVTAGATTPIVPPPGDPSVRTTSRLPPPAQGRGYLEAVLDSEIERVAAEQAARPDPIKGHINRVVYESELSVDPAYHTHVKGDANLIGRFGWKARTATVDDFIAGALLGDIGITSPLRPVELPNPDAITDDLKPGIDVTIDEVAKLAFYVRHLAIPPRYDLFNAQGVSLFKQVGCANCHVPSLKTRADWPVKQVAGIDAYVFTDFLLHNMGADLADSIPSGTIDGQAGSQDWRTGALIGLRFMKSFLHDGRAVTVEDAILKHEGTGSEATPCIEDFKRLTTADRAILLQYVEGL